MPGTTSSAVRIRRRQPDYVILLALATITSVTWWLGVVPAPDSLAHQLPAWAIITYYVSLTLGATTGWVSVAWPRGATGTRTVLLAELASRWAIGGACLVASLAILAYAGARGFTAAMFYLAWAATSAWRIFHIVADYRTYYGKPLTAELRRGKHAPR